MALSYEFLKEGKLGIPSKLETQCKRDMHFSFIFGWHSIQLHDWYCGLRTGDGGLIQHTKSVKRDIEKLSTIWMKVDQLT